MRYTPMLLTDKAHTARDLANELCATDDLASAVAVAQRLTETATSTLQTAVLGMRDQGASWEQVGRELGITRQAAQQRFGGLSAH